MVFEYLTSHKNIGVNISEPAKRWADKNLERLTLVFS
jgi:hypothetical protein